MNNLRYTAEKVCKGNEKFGYEQENCVKLRNFSLEDAAKRLQVRG